MFIINELLTTVTYTGNGTQTNFDIPFDYLRKSFVFASINNEATSDFTIDGRTLIFNEAPAEEAIIVIYRKTDTKPLVSWADASVFRSGDMTISQVQQLHIIEEGQDWSKVNSIVLNNTGDAWEGRGYRIQNVADPQNPQDVVTKKYMETVQGGFVQQNTALVQEATQQASIATTKAGEASASASAAKTSETNAQKWAESTESPDGQEDADSPTGDTMSAKEWALYAKALAIKIGNPVTSTTESKGTITVQKSDGTKNTINIVKSVNGISAVNGAVDLRVKEFTDLSQIGLTKGSETLTSITQKLPANSRLSYYVSAGQGFNVSEYPSSYGYFLAENISNTIVVFTFISYAGPPSVEKLTTNLYTAAKSVWNTSLETEWRLATNANERWVVSKGNNGWAREPISGFTIAWGVSTEQKEYTWTYPRTFTTVYGVFVQKRSSIIDSGSNHIGSSVKSFNTTSAVVNADGNLGAFTYVIGIS